MQVIEQGINVPVHYATNATQYEIAKIRITFTQHDEILLEKTEEDIEWGDGEILTVLTQEETKNWNYKEPGEVQLRYKTVNGDVGKTVVEPFRIGKALNKEVL